MGRQGVAHQCHRFMQQSREQENVQGGQEAACFHFSGSSRVQPSIETVMVTTQYNGWAQVETQTGRPQLFQAHACTQTDLSRTERAAQSFSGGELQNLEDSGRGLRAEEGVMGASVLRWMSFSRKGLSCVRKLACSTVSRNLREILMSAIVL